MIAFPCVENSCNRFSNFEVYRVHRYGFRDCVPPSRSKNTPRDANPLPPSTRVRRITLPFVMMYITTFQNPESRDWGV
ncbi:hypothetical protein HYDPIDRAFT_120493 [Hydnomerulius pinastri MD-312]|uniref:Uncharacterized protein n=1 Tax=Hydnomerulius pinastri MD-312 TaxID=994086 RepID=A0A0C9W544_9AGAM|nr:hypothetical protein HYDPIDRAFT_120515 [Hydnomerulius pinastri MD-312]KIJ57649.1 hypothetical protein HYDPIDRAFT_120493 [Hydnomerulius pinastri MD-312]